jgi:hypothetical protein
VKVWVDPPQGWLYGFPKPWDKKKYPDIRSWLIYNGYAAKDIDFAMQNLRMWEENDDE